MLNSENTFSSVGGTFLLAIPFILLFDAIRGSHVTTIGATERDALYGICDEWVDGNFPVTGRQTHANILIYLYHPQ